MIKLGNKNIKQFYLGDKPLSKIYKGNQLVWQKEVYFISGKFTDDSTEADWYISTITDSGFINRIYLDVDPETKEFEYYTTDKTELMFRNNQYIEHIYSFPLALTDFQGDGYSCFYNCKKLKSVKLNNSNLQKQKNLKQLFAGCILLETCDLSEIDTSNITDVSSMFYGCKSVTSLDDVSNFDTQNVRSMSSMFYGCSNLTLLDVSNFNTFNVTSMSYMFEDCSKLTSLNVSNFNTSNVIYMNSMFYGCSGLTSLNVSNFNTSEVTNMEHMFCNCSKLTSLDLSNFDTSNVTSMHYMFCNCSSLTSLNLSNFDIQNVTNMYEMFQSCSKLRNLKLNNFGCNEEVDVDGMFKYCNNLGLDEEGETVNRQSLVDTLLTNSFDRASAGYSVLTVQLPASVLARLTDEEKEGITNKGFNLTSY